MPEIDPNKLAEALANLDDMMHSVMDRLDKLEEARPGSATPDRDEDTSCHVLINLSPAVRAKASSFSREAICIGVKNHLTDTLLAYGFPVAVTVEEVSHS